jgi:hypothetical protein
MDAALLSQVESLAYAESGDRVRVSLASFDATPTGAETGSMSAMTDAAGSATEIESADPPE